MMSLSWETLEYHLYTKLDCGICTALNLRVQSCVICTNIKKNRL